MRRSKLTALAVERAHRSGEPLLLGDGDGLYLRKQTRDGASWTVRYHFAGRQHWLTLGNYPDMPLAQARIEARAARVLLDKQQNPLSVRRTALAEERQKGSFKTLCEDWYRAEVQARGLKHPGVPRRYLDKYLLPKLGVLPASEITPSDIARLLDGIKARAPHVATRPSGCGTTHRDRSNDAPLHCPRPAIADSEIASGLQSHWLGSIDDLPARIRSPVPVQGAHRCARCGSGGVRSAALAGGSHRTLSRTGTIAAGRLPASIALLRRNPGRPRRRCPLGCEANKGTVGRFAPTAVNQRLKFLRQYGQVIAL